MKLVLETRPFNEDYRVTWLKILSLCLVAINVILGIFINW
jgi:hypothetical protein